MNILKQIVSWSSEATQWTDETVEYQELLCVLKMSECLLVKIH